MSRVVVTGATGFVGANLARRLIRDGHDVHLLLRPEHRSWRIAGIRHEVTVHELQLDDAEAADRILGSVRPRWVFHLAVYGAYSWQTDWRRMVQTNVVGTATLAEASLAAGVEVFVNTGSSSEYGFKTQPSAEADALAPNSYYAVTKAAATLFCQHLARTHGVRIPTLRLYSVFGPYEDPRRLIPALVSRGLEAELPPLADPGIARDFVYVADAVGAYIKAATISAPERDAVYNVGSGIQISLREAVEAARRRVRYFGAGPLGLNAPPTVGHLHMGRRHAHDRSRVGMAGSTHVRGGAARHSGVATVTP